MCFEVGTDYGGGDLPNGRLSLIPNHLECQERCSKRNGCFYFTWTSKNLECLLKKSKGWKKIQSDKENDMDIDEHGQDTQNDDMEID